MRPRVNKVVIGILVLIILGIFIYLWFILAVGTISYIFTILVVFLLVFGLFRLKHWLKRKKSSRNISRRNDHSEYINQRRDL